MPIIKVSLGEVNEVTGVYSLAQSRMRAWRKSFEVDLKEG